MSLANRCAKKHAKARHRRYRTAQERLTRDRRQAQHAAAALQQALNDLGLPEDLVTEIEARLSSQRKLLGKIVGMIVRPSLAAAPTLSCAVCEAGTKTCPRVCLGRSPSALGSSA